MHMPTFSVYRKKITPLRAPNFDELVLTRVDRVKSLNRNLASRFENYQLIPLWRFGGLVIFEVKPDSETKEP